MMYINGMQRIRSIDFGRGLVMIIMALDHVRDMMHVDSQMQNPLDLSTTNVLLFFTRWVTHLCAPTFVFLSGVSAWLSLKSKKNQGEARLFILKRGIWLIVLELTLVNFGFWWDIQFRTLITEVIAAIGFGFVMLAVLYDVHPKILIALGLVIVFGHDIMTNMSNSGFVFSLLFKPGVFPMGTGRIFLVGYPFIPWLGIMLCGFGCGHLFFRPGYWRKRLLLVMGLSSLALFVILRFVNLYGDPAPWSVQKNATYTILSFLNVNKYPPSLLFTLVMLGIQFIILSIAEEKKGVWMDRISVYGKTPLFYFLVHFYLIHILMFIMLFFQGFHFQDLSFGPGQMGRPKGVPSGIGLGGIYLVWIGVVIVMYPLCRWYGRYKLSHKDNLWLKYL
jgi:uncharacterized membrane protein